MIKVATEIDFPVINVLAKMEHLGMCLDVNYLNGFSKELEQMIGGLEKQIWQHAGSEFNIGSPMQLAEVLFEKLKLPTFGNKKGKNGAYSTAAEELAKLKDSHPIIDQISSYREYTKLKSTYVDALYQN